MNGITLFKKNVSQEANALNAGSEKSSRVIGVLGAKGGVGATTVTINLAASLALRYPGSVAVFDANLQQPDAACLLNRVPRYSLFDLARLSVLDGAIIAACAEHIALDNNVSNGKHFSLYSPPMEASQALQFPSGDLHRLLSEMKKQSGTVVVDLPRTVSRELITMLDLCDNIILVLEPTVTALAAAKRWFEVFRDLELESDQVFTVLNRSGGKLKEIEKQLSAELGGFPLLRLPNAYEACEVAAIEGIPVVVKDPRHGFSKGINELSRSCLLAVGEV